MNIKLKRVLLSLLLSIMASCGDDYESSTPKIIVLYTVDHVNYAFSGYDVIDPKCEDSYHVYDCIDTTLKTFHNNTRFKSCYVDPRLNSIKLDGIITVLEFTSKNCDVVTQF